MNYIDGFVADCQARGLTKHTIETYRSSVSYFLARFKDPRKVDIDQLRKYLGDLRERNLRGSTLKGAFYALSTFYSFLEYEGRVDTNPVPGFRKRHLSRVKTHPEAENIRQLISVQDMQTLVAICAGVRDRAILMTLAKTGMRRGELLGLKVDDIDLRRSVIRIPPKAKRSNRIAFIDVELSAVIQAYLMWREPIAHTSWLWISDHGGRIHKDYPGRVMSTLGGRCGLHHKTGPISERLTPHCTRHFFTTHLYRAGMRVDYIKFLRGDSLKSEAWQWYNHIDPEEVRQEYLRCVPRLLHEKPHIMSMTGVQSVYLNPAAQRGVKP